MSRREIGNATVIVVVGGVLVVGHVISISRERGKCHTVHMTLPIWRRLPFWWIVLTTTYVVAQFGDFTPQEDIWVGAIGLFVPFAFGVLFFAVFGGVLFVLLPVILLSFGLWYERKLVEYFSLGAAAHVILNLAFLFTLTIIVDYLVVGDWMSMGAFLQSLGIESPFVSEFSF